MNRHTKRVLVGSLAVAGLAIGFLVEERVRGELDVRACRRTLRAKGEMLTVGEWSRSRTNRADRLLTPSQLMALLPRSAVALEPSWPGRLPPGRQAVWWKLDEWNERGGDTNTWDRFAAAMAPVLAELPAARSALSGPRPRLWIDYSAGFNTLLPHLAPVKGFSQTLNRATLIALREQRLEEAIQNLEAGRALVDILSDDGSLIGNLVRIAVGHILVGATWQALQADGWTDTQLARLQAVWQEPRFLSGMADGLRSERVLAARYYSTAELPHQDLVSVYSTAAPFGEDATTLAEQSTWLEPLLNGLTALRRGAFVEVWRFAWSAQDQAYYLRLVQDFVELAERAVRDRDATSLRAGEPDTDLGPLDWMANPGAVNPGWYHRARHWFSQAVLGASDKALRKAAEAECHATMAVAATALKRHRLRHGRWPATLEELVPAFLPETPRDWLGGGLLRYRVETDDTFVLYSVGWDGRDEGGDSRPARGESNWLFHGQDAVWPRPATPEQLAAARSAPAGSRRR